VVANRQTHMYIETQTALVRREEDRFYVTSSTQSVLDMSLRLSQVLNVAPRDVVVSTQRIGGGFGG
jgi:putative selenate reductase molybdopterin-binding subunit